MILRLSLKRGRKIAFVVFYGKASVRTADAADRQWSDFDRDIDALCDGYEMYWLGDLNVRPGREQNAEEERVLGRYGENLPRPRDKNTTLFLQTAATWRMVRLTGQIRQKTKSYRQIGREHASSNPDDIWVSETLFLRGTHAKIVPCTLSGHESHNLVTAQVKLYRRSTARKRNKINGVVRKSVAYLRTQQGRDKFHQAVLPRLPPTEAIPRMSSEVIVSR